MITVACCLWDANAQSLPFSVYDESWVEKLYRGFRRHLSVPFRFVAFVDRERRFAEEKIEQDRLRTVDAHYGCLIEPFRLDGPAIICGLDTIVVGNVDHLAHYCVGYNCPALVGHPTDKKKFGFINPVVLKTTGWTHVYSDWRGENDMVYLNAKVPANDINEMWPGHLLSFKLQTDRKSVPATARIIYFHGDPKPSELMDRPWVRENWA